MSIVRRSQLQDPDRVRLDEIMARFQANWNSDAMKSLPAAFEHYLPQADDHLRVLALRELITRDMTSRWKIGQKVRIEFYLSAFPELENYPDLSVMLIYEEFRIRAALQEPIDVMAYQERFPKLFDQIYRYVRDQGGSHDTLITDTVKAPRPATHPIAPSGGATSSPDGRAFTPDFSSYELEKRIGAGQFGEVWKATAPGGVDVALKIIPWPKAHKMSQMELRALEVMKRMRHAFMVQVHAYWPMENQVAIVMELADGSLEDRLKECRAEGEMGIEREELISYIYESAEAIDHLHQHGILHRDIKPANILLIQGHAKVGDFGVARGTTPDQVDTGATCVGTPQFMGPEVWENQVQPKSDQYSLAITYAELRLGRAIFNAQSLGELLRSHTTMTPDLAPMPANEQAIVLKALAKRPEDRYETCVDFVTALRDMVAAEKRAIIEKAERLKRRIVIGTIITVCVALAVAAFVFAPGKSDPELDFPAEVVLSAGANASTFSLALVNPPRKDFELSERSIKFEGLPPGITLDLEPDPKESNKLRVQVAADLEAQSTEADAKITFELEGKKLERKFTLRVGDPNALMPPNTTKAPNAKAVRIGDSVYWSHLNLTLPTGDTEVAGMPIELILIERTNPSDPDPFYIMKHKVWNALYSKFYDDQVDKFGLKPDWQTIDPLAGSYDASEYPLRPVFNVPMRDAIRFANWIQGNLPSDQEWKKASGVFDYQKPPYSSKYVEGPYLGTWDSESSGEITVGLDILPTDVGTASKDISLFGLTDIAGNGQEYSSKMRDHLGNPVTVDSETTQLGQTEVLLLFGRSYEDDTPLRFKNNHLVYFNSDYDFETHGSIDVGSNTISFRVTLPIPYPEEETSP